MIQCFNCKHFHQRPERFSGRVNPAQIGYCCHGMEHPGRKKDFWQPGAPDRQQGQWPFTQKRCRNFEERSA